MGLVELSESALLLLVDWSECSHYVCPCICMHLSAPVQSSGLLDDVHASRAGERVLVLVHGRPVGIELVAHAACLACGMIHVVQL